MDKGFFFGVAASARAVSGRTSAVGRHFRGLLIVFVLVSGDSGRQEPEIV